MIKTLAFAVSIVLAAAASAQENEAPKPSLVSVSSKGNDVRVVLHDMFKQVEKSFVLEPNIRFYLYLSLEKIEFEEALQLICKISSLKVEVQNGIFFIGQAKPSTPGNATATASPTTTPKPQAVKGAYETKPTPPKGKLPETVLNKRVTTRLDKVDLRVLLSNLSQQSGVPLEVDASVPAYKLDAYLINTSLKYALDTICGAAKLQYRLTDNHSIAVTKPQLENRVAVVSGTD